MLSGFSAAQSRAERREQVSKGVSEDGEGRALNATQRETLACAEGTCHCAAHASAMATASARVREGERRTTKARRWILIRWLTRDREGAVSRERGPHDYDPTGQRVCASTPEPGCS